MTKTLFPWRDNADLASTCTRLGLPKKYLKFNLDDLEPVSDDQAAALDACRAWVEAFKINKSKREDGTGLLLYGPPGTGKTMLATLVLKAVIERGYPRSRGYFTPFYEYVKLFTDVISMNEGEQEAARHLLWRIKNEFDVVVLDDVGKEYKSGSGWSETEFNYLMRTRFDHELPTIITSNYGPTEWSTSYGDAAASFMREGFAPVPLKGKDVRGKK